MDKEHKHMIWDSESLVNNAIATRGNLSILGAHRLCASRYLERMLPSGSALVFNTVRTIPVLPLLSLLGLCISTQKLKRVTRADVTTGTASPA